MKASYMVIKDVLDAPDPETSKTLEKFAGRYKNDEELQAVYRLCLGGDTEQARLKLRGLYDSRRLESGGSHLQLKDRRHLKDHRGLEDY